jgi:Sec-independent protein translocase protein TatA
MNKRWKKLVPVKISANRRSISNVQVMGLFGLGGLEIAIICVGIGIVLGPQTIGNLLRSTGKTASEYKIELSKVPDEFRKGYEEGQVDARSRKAKPMVQLADAEDLKDDTDKC